MKSYLVIFVLCMTLVGLNEACAQRHPSSKDDDRGSSGGGPRGRFNEFRKMKLIEVLKLNEEDAARFVAKESAHEDATRKLMTQRNDLLDDIRKSLRDNKDKDKGDAKDLTKPVDQVLDLDQQIFKERQRYQEEMRKFLSPEKFARFLVFEREFGRGVGDILKNLVHDHLKEREE